MSQEERKRIRKKITISTFVLLGVVVAFLILAIITKTVPIIVYNSVIVAFLIAYWVLLDIVEPRLLHEFDDITPERMNAYYKFIAIDALGYAGIAFFVFTMGTGGSLGIMGAVVYVISISVKKKFMDEFRGVAQKKEADGVESLPTAADMDNDEIEDEEEK